MNLKSSYQKCLHENAVELYYNMPNFFINKINKTVFANYSGWTVCCNCKNTFSMNELRRNFDNWDIDSSGFRKLLLYKCRSYQLGQINCHKIQCCQILKCQHIKRVLNFLACHGKPSRVPQLACVPGVADP